MSCQPPTMWLPLTQSVVTRVPQVWLVNLHGTCTWTRPRSLDNRASPLQAVGVSTSLLPGRVPRATHLGGGSRDSRDKDGLRRRLAKTVAHGSRHHSTGPDTSRPLPLSAHVTSPEPGGGWAQARSAPRPVHPAPRLAHPSPQTARPQGQIAASHSQPSRFHVQIVPPHSQLGPFQGQLTPLHSQLTPPQGPITPPHGLPTRHAQNFPPRG